jgi:hypothetical protein
LNLSVLLSACMHTNKFVKTRRYIACYMYLKIRGTTKAHTR